jgi:hypothetical protein
MQHVSDNVFERLIDRGWTSRPSRLEAGGQGLPVGHKKQLTFGVCFQSSVACWMPMYPPKMVLT